MEKIVKLFRNKIAEVKLTQIEDTYNVSCKNKDSGSIIARNNIKDYELAEKEFMYFVYRVEALASKESCNVW